MNIQSSPGTASETEVCRLKRATDYWKHTPGATGGTTRTRLSLLNRLAAN